MRADCRSVSCNGMHCAPGGPASQGGKRQYKTPQLVISGDGQVLKRVLATSGKSGYGTAMETSSPLRGWGPKTGGHAELNESDDGFVCWLFMTAHGRDSYSLLPYT